MNRSASVAECFPEKSCWCRHEQVCLRGWILPMEVVLVSAWTDLPPWPNASQRSRVGVGMNRSASVAECFPEKSCWCRHEQVCLRGRVLPREVVLVSPWTGLPPWPNASQRSRVGVGMNRSASVAECFPEKSCWCRHEQVYLRGRVLPREVVLVSAWTGLPPWLNASQRSRVGVAMNRSASVAECFPEKSCWCRHEQVCLRGRVLPREVVLVSAWTGLPPWPSASQRSRVGVAMNRSASVAECFPEKSCWCRHEQVCLRGRVLPREVVLVSAWTGLPPWPSASQRSRVGVGMNRSASVAECFPEKSCWCRHEQVCLRGRVLPREVVLVSAWTGLPPWPNASQRSRVGVGMNRSASVAECFPEKSCWCRHEQVYLRGRVLPREVVLVSPWTGLPPWPNASQRSRVGVGMNRSASVAECFPEKSCWCRHEQVYLRGRVLPREVVLVSAWTGLPPWLNASQRSRVGVGMNRSASVAECFPEKSCWCRHEQVCLRGRMLPREVVLVSAWTGLPPWPSASQRSRVGVGMNRSASVAECFPEKSCWCRHEQVCLRGRVLPREVVLVSAWTGLPPWPNASQRSRVGVGMNRSASVAECFPEKSCWCRHEQVCLRGWMLPREVVLVSAWTGLPPWPSASQRSRVGVAMNRSASVAECFPEKSCWCRHEQVCLRGRVVKGMGHLDHVWSYGVLEVVSSIHDRGNIVGWVFHPDQVTGKVFSSEHAFPSKFWIYLEHCPRGEAVVTGHLRLSSMR